MFLPMSMPSRLGLFAVLRVAQKEKILSVSRTYPGELGDQEGTASVDLSVLDASFESGAICARARSGMGLVCPRSGCRL